MLDGSGLLTESSLFGPGFGEPGPDVLDFSDSALGRLRVVAIHTSITFVPRNSGNFSALGAPLAPHHTPVSTRKLISPTAGRIPAISARLAAVPPDTAVGVLEVATDSDHRRTPSPRTPIDALVSHAIPLITPSTTLPAVLELTLIHNIEKSRAGSALTKRTLLTGARPWSARALCALILCALIQSALLTGAALAGAWLIGTQVRNARPRSAETWGAQV
ncbi:hypothetical protein [Kribbella antiqua]|uniref:hypothetical protein n=1 Tax=Kribbella antiqua TaxID=2512217 RepID=UPI00104A9DE7|nr:hypothetical protein [Kribbella antiqua]